MKGQPMLDGRYDQHFLEVLVKSQDNPGPERHRRLATWLVPALWMSGIISADIAL
jgi:hypothetical protein